MTITDTETFTVYIHERGKRPRPLDVTHNRAFPSLWRDGDRTLFFAGADLVAHTVTYTDIRPPAVAS